MNKPRHKTMNPELYDTPEINRANLEHDRRYGWSIMHPNIYTAPDWTCTVVTRASKHEPDALWPEIIAFQAAKRLKVLGQLTKE